MPLPLWILSTIMGVIEGLTEFIPISSTGHLIIADHFLQFKQALGDPNKAELFEIVIQLGAILAIGFLYRAKLWNALNAKNTHSGPGRLRSQLVVAFIPVAIVGFFLHSTIKEYLWSPMTVAVSLIIGGFIILYVESFISVHKQKIDMKTMTTKDALKVGLAQILSLIPGVSRSGATIIGGMMGGMTRETATEFSFLLSFPVMIAASGYELYKYRDVLSKDMFATLGIGFAVSFIVALADDVPRILFAEQAAAAIKRAIAFRQHGDRSIVVAGRADRIECAAVKREDGHRVAGVRRDPHRHDRCRAGCRDLRADDFVEPRRYVVNAYERTVGRRGHVRGGAAREVEIERAR